MIPTAQAKRRRNVFLSPIKKVRYQLQNFKQKFYHPTQQVLCTVQYIFNFPGGSLSNLSCLSDFESSASKSSSRNKKSRSSVSSRSREGGSLPPTKFENVMLYESSNSAHHNFAWDTGPQVSSGSLCVPLIRADYLLTTNGGGNDSNLIDCYVKFGSVWGSS